MRGGKRLGSGRPKKPSRERRDVVLCVRLSHDEARAITNESIAQEIPVVVWMREVLLKAARFND